MRFVSDARGQDLAKYRPLGAQVPFRKTILISGPKKSSSEPMEIPILVSFRYKLITLLIPSAQRLYGISLWISVKLGSLPKLVLASITQYTVSSELCTCWAFTIPEWTVSTSTSLHHGWEIKDSAQVHLGIDSFLPQISTSPGFFAVWKGSDLTHCPMLPFFYGQGNFYIHSSLSRSIF